MNTARVLLGGLVAGVVLNVGEGILNAGILMDDYEAIFASTGLVEADWAMVGYIGSTFVLGFVVAWIYAAIRPRYGPGWKTGVRAGAALWCASYLVPSIWFGAMGMGLGQGMLALALVWGFAEQALAGVAAGWVYREGETASMVEPPAEVGMA